MEKVYKEIELEKVVFLVDIDKLELRQKDQPENVRSYLEMSRGKNHFTLEMNTRTKSISRDNAFIHGDPSIKRIKVPQMKDVDPEGMAMKYGKTLEQVKASSDYELWLEANALEQRTVHGRLPIVEIRGSEYYVDLRMECLRPHNNFASDGIPIDVEWDPEVLVQSLYVDLKRQEAFDPDYSATEMPKNIVQISIPGSRFLDPVGYYKLYNLDAEEILSETPMVMYHHARVTPLEFTELGEIILNNQFNKKVHHALETKDYSFLKERAQLVKSADYKGMISIGRNSTLFRKDLTGKYLIQNDNNMKVSTAAFTETNGYLQGYIHLKSAEIMSKKDRRIGYLRDCQDWEEFRIPSNFFSPAGLTSEEVHLFNEGKHLFMNNAMIIDEGLNARLNGTLNRIVFDQETYIVDLPDLSFTNLNDPNAIFKFDLIDLFHTSVKLYDTALKIPVNQSEEPINNKNLIKVEFSPINEFDPVGWDMLRNQPFRRLGWGFCWNGESGVVIDMKPAATKLDNAPKKSKVVRKPRGKRRSP